MGRDTRTGVGLRADDSPITQTGGYDYNLRVKVGQRLGCGAHYVDVIADKGGANVKIVTLEDFVARANRGKL